MKRQKVRKIVGILCILVILCNSGCMGKRETVEDKVVNYMNDKYNDVFTFGELLPGGGPFTRNGIYDTTVYSAKYSDTSVYVRYVIDDAGGETYSDDYMSIKYEQQRNELLWVIVENVFSDCRVMMPRSVGGGCTKGASDAMTFEEYMAEPSSAVSLRAVIGKIYDDVGKEQIEKDLESAIVEAGICCSGVIYFDSGTQEFEELVAGQRSYSDYYDEAEVFVFEMETTDGFSETEWRRGRTTQ